MVRNDPTPAYARIADELRERIRSGALKPGESLEPLREAAKQFGVNLHTVRHAYTELQREGLVEMRRRTGTRVRRSARDEDALGGFIEQVTTEARRRFGLDPAALARQIETGVDAAASRPEVTVLECSASQVDDLAAQLETRFHVRAHARRLDDVDLLPDGPIVATFFHYNEIRRRWPEQLGEVRFVTIAPDPGLAGTLGAGGAGGGRRTVRVCEFDEPTAGAVRADLHAILPTARFRLEPTLICHATDALAGRGRTKILFAPRVWDTLTVDERADPRAVELRYVFDPTELRAIATDLGWNPAPSHC